MRDIDYWVWLSTLSGLGPVKAGKLLEAYKNPREIFYLSEAELKRNRQITAKNVEEIINMEKRERVNSINEKMLKNDIKIITLFDSNYPKLLRQIYDPPVALYYRGDFKQSEFSIAIVGTRKTTNYGALTAKRLSFELALRGVQIVSGLARGIDSIAHEGCLDAAGKTVAVLGCGPEYIYPPENSRLYENILKSGGLILSEYPPGTPPLQHNFPARNRIISGLSSGVLIVEAAKRSGSLITAGCALEQGREVFAVPGNIDCAYSRGTNQLIRDGAKIVLEVEDILEEFGFQEDIENVNNKSTKADREMTGKSELRAYRGLGTEEIHVAKIIKNGIHSIDEIIERSNIPAKDINNILFMLEMKGVIVQLPGKHFEICL